MVGDFSVDASFQKSEGAKPAEVFLDQKEMKGDVLTDALRKGLDESKYLVVICSPNSARSPYVDLEIEYFIRTKGLEFVIPIVINGFDPEQQGDETWLSNKHLDLRKLFHADFRLREGETGKVCEGWTHLRYYRKNLLNQEHGSPKERKDWIAAYAESYAKARNTLLTRLFKLTPNEIRIIDEGQEGRKLRLIKRVSVVSCVVMSMVVGVIVRSERAAQAEKVRAETASGKAIAERAKAEEAKGIAEREKTRAEAAMKTAESERTKATQALKIAEREQAKAERSQRFIGDAHEQMAFLVGEVLMDLRKQLEPVGKAGLVDEARNYAIDHLGTLAPGDDTEDGRYMRAVTLGNRGILAMQTGDFAAAEDLFSQAKKLQIDLLLDEPRSMQYRHGKALACDNLGDLHLSIARAKVPNGGAIDPEDKAIGKAIDEYQQGLAIAAELAAAPDVAPLMRNDLAVGYFKIAQAQLAAQEFPSAAKSLDLGLPFAEQAAAADPDYDRWQACVAAYQLLIGQSAVQLGKDAEALASLAKSEEVFARLLAKAPENRNYQRMMKQIKAIQEDLK